MTKMIAFHQDAREPIRRGVGKLTKAVRSTLGPCGHTVLLAKSFGPPTVTKDGVTVAKEIDLEDPFENIGAKMVREVTMCDDAYVQNLAEAVAGKLGGKVGVAPRIFLKKLVTDILDRVDQFPDFNPRANYTLTMTDTDRHRDDRRGTPSHGCATTGDKGGLTAEMWSR